MPARPAVAEPRLRQLPRRESTLSISLTSERPPLSEAHQCATGALRSERSLRTRWLGSLPNAEDDFPKQVSGRKAPMRLRRIGQRILGADRQLQFRSLHRFVQSREFFGVRDDTVECHADVESRARKGLHAVEIGYSAASVLSERIDAMLECIAAGESQYGIDAVWRKASGGCRNVSRSAVHHFVGAQSANECEAVIGRCGCEHLTPRSFASWMARVPTAPEAP